ncbi:Uncharacterised protein [Mycobacterium tuberculosis]|nr:Uncharacterised protein [Mycobacterium tuberculosis]
MRAGTPPITANGGTSLVTTEPAPMIAPSPMVRPLFMLTREPIHTSLPITVRSSCGYSCVDTWLNGGGKNGWCDTG